MTIVTPPPAIDRDRWGRPLVTPANGGKPVAYTRCTTYIDVLEDKFNLQKWMQRMVALGLASRPDLLLSVSAHRDDKKQLDRICEDAREAAAASAAATTGTALHALTELVDRGEPLPVIPANAQSSLDKYAEATANLKVLEIERFLVLDTLKIGGTADRLVKDGSDIKIADIKTGSIEWGALKIAMQLAIYARSYMYDITTGKRTPSGASVHEGIVIHLPAVEDPAEARCDLYAVDLIAGWHAVQVAKDVRAKRGLKFADLMHPLGSLPVEPEPKTDRTLNQILANPGGEPLAHRIAKCETADAVRALWVEHAAEWNDDLTTVAKEHIASLPDAS